MQTFEILIFISIFTSIILSISKIKTLQYFSIIFLVLSTISYSLFENFRWQMALSLILIAFILVSYFWITKSKRKKWQKFLWIMLCFVGFCGALMLPIFFPVFEFPQPTGSHNIGTKYLLLTDSSRIELFEPNSGLKREIAIQAYYPAKIDSINKPETYWENASELSKIWTKTNGFNKIPFIWSHFNLIKTHSYLNAEISSTKQTYPVIIFSHGYWQLNKFNTAIIEELTSYGYIVLNISHDYETPFIIYPDKTIKIFNKNNTEFKKRIEEDYKFAEIAGDIFKKLSETDKWNEQKELYKQLYNATPYWWESNVTWMKDIQFCIDMIPYLNSQIFNDKLDTNKIGVMGFSFGGGASGLAAIIDDRIKAGINLDGWQYGHLLEKNLTCPFMFMSSEGHGWASDFFFERAESTVYDININKMRHANFNDMALTVEIPGRIIGRLGSINGKQGIKLVKKYTISFFEKHLQGNDSHLLDGPSDQFPEVEIKSRN